MAVLLASGDIIAQNIECSNHPNRSFDYKRLTITSLIGFSFLGPMLHFWYRFLVNLLGSARTTQTAIRMLVLDQLCAAPFFIYSFVFLSSFLKAVPTPPSSPLPSVSDIPHYMQSSLRHTSKVFPTILMTNYMVWPFANFISFRFVPEQYRVLYNAVLGVFWNTFLCLSTHKKYQCVDDIYN